MDCSEMLKRSLENQGKKRKWQKPSLNPHKNTLQKIYSLTIKKKTTFLFSCAKPAPYKIPCQIHLHPALNTLMAQKK